MINRLNNIFQRSANLQLRSGNFFLHLVSYSPSDTTTMIKKFLLFISAIILLLNHTAFSTHLMGGSLTYAYIAYDPGSNTTQYHVTLKIYRYCDATGGGTAALDPSQMLGVYLQDPLNPNADKSIAISITHLSFVSDSIL